MDSGENICRSPFLGVPRISLPIKLKDKRRRLNRVEHRYVPDVAETYAKIGDCLERMARSEPDKLLARTEVRASDGMHKLKKVEARSANDEELKLTDTLTYFTRDTQAAKVGNHSSGFREVSFDVVEPFEFRIWTRRCQYPYISWGYTLSSLRQVSIMTTFVPQSSATKLPYEDLLYRRLRCLANYEAANKNLERARGRNNKDIPKAENEQQEACKKFEDISALAKTELKDLKKRRVLAFKKNLADLADLEIKHAK
ncbi:hypothetical protein TELCIR_04261, partial [Teladorsagia circumcincta]